MLSVPALVSATALTVLSTVPPLRPGGSGSPTALPAAERAPHVPPVPRHCTTVTATVSPLRPGGCGPPTASPVAAYPTATNYTGCSPRPCRRSGLTEGGHEPCEVQSPLAREVRPNRGRR